ncbi:MAG TPA: ATP-binding protein [Terriglobales bacterium]|jgi:anti-sigma regulatory factor (Ser/Thr protein kinase)/ActR/RegA family two-component response regulator|nr:ATP-binding protein [Terriglobales bacterium]
MNALSQIELGPIPVRTALVVGQDAEIEEQLRGILDPDLWVLGKVSDNAAALVVARNRNFDLILTDAKTSGREDVELLRKLRRARPHSRLIIVAEESTPADVIASMREHAFAYFSKPFSPNALAVMIRHAINEPCWDDGIDVISATPEWIRISARCDLGTADRVLQFFDEIAELPNPERCAVGMAFREMLMNAIEHGGRLDPDQQVEISYLRVRHMVTCRISDPGEGFTLDEIPHAAIANPADDPLHHIEYREAAGMRPGGFGVLLTQKLVDELVYNEQGNEVLLVKYLNFEPRSASPLPETNDGSSASR